MGLAHEAVRAIGAHQEVGIAQIGQAGDGRAEAQVHAEAEAALLENVQEGEPGDAGEAVAPDRDALAPVDGVHAVPGLGRPGDGGVAFLVPVLEERERAVREDDAPAERVLGAVALDDGDAVPRVLLLEQDGEVESCGAAAENRDVHSRARTSAPPTNWTYAPGTMQPCGPK